MLQNIINGAGLQIKSQQDVESVWKYPDTTIALRGILSAGPVAKAIELIGFEKVKSVFAKAIQLHKK